MAGKPKDVHFTPIHPVTVNTESCLIKIVDTKGRTSPLFATKRQAMDALYIKGVPRPETIWGGYLIKHQVDNTFKVSRK